MASSTIVFLFFAGLVVPGYSGPEEEKQDIFVMAAQKCNVDIKAPQSAIEHLKLKDKLDGSREGKCLIKCALRLLGLLYEDGHINKVAKSTFIRTTWGNAEDQEKAQKAIDRCFDEYVKIEDICERAFQFINCYYDEERKGNIPKV